MDLDSKRHSPRTRSSKRKYHAKKNATGARTTIVALGVQPPTSPPQIAHVAFNIHGWGTTDPMSGRRGLFEVINAQKATMVRGGFAAKIAELQCKNSCDIYRQDLTYTARELDTTLPGRDPGVVPYLVVGYTLQEDDPVFISNVAKPWTSIVSTQGLTVCRKRTSDTARERWWVKKHHPPST